VGAATAVYSTAGDGYDGHGNLLRMPQLQAVQWDFKDQLRMSQRQSVDGSDASGLQHQGERTWYVYDSGGQRVRKVTELAGKRVDQRITLAGFEVYQREGGSPLTRETLHVMDDRRRIALVETRTDGGVSEQLVRYQLGNHLGSACLELDDQAQVITYEEYTPYGSSSYQGVRGQTVPAKRYRYTGRERDEESGLEYHGTRYYVPWLGRWMSADPIGVADGLDVYLYCKDNPVLLTDGMGTDARVSVDQASSTITYSTTVHVYATAAEIAQFQPAATRATQFYRDASGAVTIDGRVWNVRYDVSFQFHDTAVSPVPLGIQTIYDQLSDPSLEPMLRSAPGLMALYNTGLSSAFASGTAQVPGFRLGDSVLSFNRQVTVGNTFQIVPPMLPIAGMHLFPEPTTRAVIGLNPAQNATEENLFRAVIHEVGHTLGFDERYSPEPGAPHHEGYESDFMTSRDLSRDVTFDPRHRAGSARFGEFVANGRNVNDVALRDISIDSTGHGGFPEEANGIHQSDYDTIQSSLRRDVWTRFRQQLTPPPPPPMLQLFPGPLDRQGTIQILPQYDQHTLPGSVDILRLHFW
jgi:RHS repeat-associated protein